MQSEPAGRNPPIEAAWMCDQQELLIIAGGTTPVLVFIDPCASAHLRNDMSSHPCRILECWITRDLEIKLISAKFGLRTRFVVIDCSSRWSLTYKTAEEAVYSTWEPFCFPTWARDARNPGWTWSMHMVQSFPKHICNLYSGLKGQPQCNINLSFNSINFGFKQDKPSIYST